MTTAIVFSALMLAGLIAAVLEISIEATRRRKYRFDD
jgi:hypothetical protein